ncbi:hypothetical protein ACTXLS_07820 [Corynebacterium variabile]|uniref:hypothetical protein n=1 Tax=Corynebacterium variabile TaxID=1727 RepID=UPI003FD4F52F
MTDRPRFKSAEPYFNEFIDQDADVRQIAEKVVSDPQWVNSAAEVAYRCRGHRSCLLAAVIRHHGQRYLFLRNNQAPQERHGETRPAVERLDCLRVNADGTTVPNPPLSGVTTWNRLDCGHARYVLTAQQLQADVKRLRGTRRRVVMIDGSKGLNALLAANPDLATEDIPVVNTKVR